MIFVSLPSLSRHADIHAVYACRDVAAAPLRASVIFAEQNRLGFLMLFVARLAAQRVPSARQRCCFSRAARHAQQRRQRALFFRYAMIACGAMPGVPRGSEAFSYAHAMLHAP